MRVEPRRRRRLRGGMQRFGLSVESSGKGHAPSLCRSRFCGARTAGTPRVAFSGRVYADATLSVVSTPVGFVRCDLNETHTRYWVVDLVRLRDVATGPAAGYAGVR